MSEKCQVCGSKNTKIVTQTEEFEYKGKTIEVKNYRKTVCNNCGEAVPDEGSVNRSIPILRDAQRTIDGFLTGNEIKTIRTSFNMTQDDFSTLLGGGEKAFARYETGKVLQSKPMDNLLRILHDCPEGIHILKKDYPKHNHCIDVEETETEFVQVFNKKPFEYIFEGNRIKKAANE